MISIRSDGSKCPYCSGYILLKGFNDFATLYPQLAEEWSDRNLPLTPDKKYLDKCYSIEQKKGFQKVSNAVANLMKVNSTDGMIVKQENIVMLIDVFAGS